MNKLFSFLLVSLVCASAIAQPGNDVLRGPQNTLPDGVIDGVVVEDEVPVRSRVEYEYVRLADYAQSWRVYSRIDAREKVNTKLFYPYDYFTDNYQFPKTRSEISNQGWVRNQERWSLWTVIANHIILGDLTVFKVSSDENPLIEDGYQLKYPIVQKTKDDFFTNAKYRSAISKTLSYGAKGKDMTISRPVSEDEWIVQKSGSSYSAWLDSLLNDPNVLRTDDGLSDYEALERRHLSDSAFLKQAWESAADGMALKEPDVVKFVNSQAITAYNIKEDWFFDKERSMLDKRIICIAPVARFKYDSEKNRSGVEEQEEIVRYSNFIGVSPTGALEVLEDGQPSEFTEEFVELEMFWLYFPQLRHVMVNYYVYNDQNDAYRMSYDDLFWKRMFSARMYKKTDQYDRSVEDYRYGVDALYEAEKFKETMRTWETDLWNY
jgi:hypothetical protein